MLEGKTYLSGSFKSLATQSEAKWEKVSGPGKVRFTDPKSLKTTATSSETGEYKVALSIMENGLESIDTLMVDVVNAPEDERLDVVYTRKYSIDNPIEASWEPDFLHGVVVLNGKWVDGSKLTAIPYWTRNNRLDMYDKNEYRSMRVWLKKE